MAGELPRPVLRHGLNRLAVGETASRRALDLRRAVPALLALAVTAVAATGAWSLNRPYAAADRVFTSEVLAGAPIIDARGALAYRRERIPGAAWLWSRAFLDYAAQTPGVLAPPQAFAPRLAALGLAPGQPVTVYDQGEGTDAPLVALVLHAFGIEARVLEGGFDGWLAAGGKPESGLPPAAVPTVADSSLWAFDPRLLVPAEQAARHLAENLVAPVDVRGGDAYAGLHLERAVSLPAAVLAPGAKLPRWSDLANLLAAARITSDTHVLLYGTDLAETAIAWLAFSAFGRPHLHVVAGPFAWLEAAGLPMTSTPLESAASLRSKTICWNAAP